MLSQLPLNKAQIETNLFDYYANLFLISPKQKDFIKQQLNQYYTVSNLFLKSQNPNTIYTNGILHSHVYNKSMLTYKAPIRYYNELLSEYSNYFDDYISSVKNSNDKILSDYRYLSKQVLQSKIKREKSVSKVLIINDFKDAGNSNLRDLKDPKTNKRFVASHTLDTKDETLNLRKTSQNIIPVKIASIDYNESNFDSNTSLNRIDDISDLVYIENPWRCLVAINSNKPICELTLLFEFDYYEYINSINISYACILEMFIEENGVKYLDENSEWQDIQVFNEEFNDSFDLHFETIRTKYIKIKFNQDKALENVQLANSYYKLFDMSINKVEFKYSYYSSFGLFRSNQYLIASKPLSLDYYESYIYKDNDVYTELYLKLLGYDENLNVKFDETIAYPDDSTLIKEMVSFGNKEYKLRFIPNELSLKLYCVQTGEILIGANQNTSYQISLDGGQTYRNSLSDNSNQIYSCGDYFIRFLGVKQNREYYIEYELAESFYLDSRKHLIYSENQLLFLGAYNSYYYLINPMVLLKTKTVRNDSTSIINRLTLLCEESEDKENQVSLNLQNNIKEINKDNGYVFL